MRPDVDNAKDVRFNFVHSAPDIVAFQDALGAELSTKVVMPAVVPSTEAEPYMGMMRFESGDGGNPHFHGFSVGSGGPSLGRVRGDVQEDPQSDAPEWSDDDGQETAAVLDESTVIGGAAGPALVDDDDDDDDDDVLAPPAPHPEQRSRKKPRVLHLTESYRPIPGTRTEQNAHVQNQSDMERVFADYFGDLVSEWNPCYDDDGNVRYKWDEDVGAHDVEVSLDDVDASASARVADVNPKQPERTHLRAVLDKVFADPGGEDVDLTPLRLLVAALVQTSCRHDRHQMEKPTLGVHSCARGTPECPVCRYGFPLSIVARGGNRLMRLDKGDKFGSWFARFPRNNRLCGNHNVHVRLDNLGNTDWRPCMSLWAVCEYITKYATESTETDEAFWRLAQHRCGRSREIRTGQRRRRHAAQNIANGF